MDTHTRPFACENCKQHFTTSGNLKRHERGAHGKHGGPETYKCPHQGCKAFSSRKEHLKAHLHGAHGERATKQKRDSLERGDGEGLGLLGEVKRPKRETEQTIRPTNTRRGLTIDQLCS